MSWEKARKAALERDDGICRRCGDYATDVHHRVLRGMGGTKNKNIAVGMANLISLCRSCHSHVHLNVAESYESGFIVHSWGDPETVSIVTKFGTLELREDGTSIFTGSCGPLF